LNEITGKELTTEVKKDVSMFVVGARDLVIASEQEMIYARDNIRAGRALKEKIIEWFKPMKEAARAAHLSVCNKETAELLPISEGMDIYSKKITAFQIAEKQSIDAETKRLEEAARKKREAAEKKAHARIDALAEKCLGANEQIVELQASLNDPDITDDGRDIIEARISSLIVSMESAKGDIIKSQVKLEAAVEAPVPLPVAAAPKVKGVGGIKTEKIPEVMNPYVLLAAVVAKTIPIAVVDFNMVQIKRLVNAGMTLPGVVTTDKYKTNIR
jgi:hypothetical protein